jgi:hypothetical protein
MTTSPSTSSDIELRAGEAIYFFALAGAPSLPEIDGAVEGLTDAPVRCIACGDRTAVVDRVDRADWAGEDAEENLQSIEWVGPRAVRHEEVIEAVMEKAPVFPARFGTLFSSVEQLVRRIASRQDALQAYFERIAGCREWTLRGHLEREVAQEALADSDDGSETRPGTAYLKKQKRVQDARGDVEAWLDEVAARLDRRLASSAKEIEPQEPPPRSSEAGEPVLERALLVPVDHEDALRTTLREENDRLADRGLQLALNGPWPPYSFRPAEEDRPSTPK